MTIEDAIKDKILILDGAMGTMIQRYSLTEDDYRGSVFAESGKELKGNNECLNLTRPDIIRAIHGEYIAAGADIIETNTFSANAISQSEYGCEGFAFNMAYEGARIAREAADEAQEILCLQNGCSFGTYRRKHCFRCCPARRNTCCLRHLRQCRVQSRWSFQTHPRRWCWRLPRCQSKR